ncbi:hypothetical protein ABPG73_014113 [Tetrahymena malaccensis]
MKKKGVQVDQNQKFDCSYCKKCFSHDKKQDFCDCSICQNCMKEYFRTRLIKSKVIRHCPKDHDHKIYMDTLLEKPIYRDLFQTYKGKVYYMLLTIAILALACSYYLPIDRVLQISFCILVFYNVKADVNPKQKYYFIYALYIPLIYWFVTKTALQFMEMLSPLHVVWFTFIHLEFERKNKVRIFVIWVSQIIWQILFFVCRYYLLDVVKEYASK